MIVLFTDFGTASPYPGQMKAAIAQTAPGEPVIDLLHEAPRMAPKPASYLLAALAPAMPAGAVIVAVVDPGVGGGRAPIAVKTDVAWFVGPDNGLFEMVIRRAASVAVWRIDWRPPILSASFHGRDLFAPVAAMIARGAGVARTRFEAGAARRQDWPDELAEIVYIDPFGNAMTGVRAAVLPAGARLAAGGRPLDRARTFGAVAAGTPFWYENANGLAEIAVNRGSAADLLGLAIGSPIEIADAT